MNPTEKKGLRDEARDPETPPERLAELAKSSDSMVRWLVAGNLSTPAGTLAQLARDEDADVRIEVAGNSHTPVQARDMLEKDDNANVAAAAIRARTRLGTAPMPAPAQKTAPSWNDWIDWEAEKAPKSDLF